MNGRVKPVYVLVILLLLYLNSISSAVPNAHFFMDISDTLIGFGDDTTMQIYAWAEGAESGNGILTWQLDTMLEGFEDGIVGVKGGAANPEITVFEPYAGFYLISGALFVDDPYTGVVRALGGFSIEDLSNLGVGDGAPENYTLMAEIVLVGLAPGTVTYELGSYTVPLEDNFYATLVDDTKLTGQFRDDLSVYEITVVPEPSSLVLLAATAAIGLGRRRQTIIKK